MIVSAYGVLVGIDSSETGVVSGVTIDEGLTSTFSNIVGLGHKSGFATVIPSGQTYSFITCVVLLPRHPELRRATNITPISATFT